MRLAVFTADTQLEQSTWWPLILATPGLTGALICRQRVSRRPQDVLRRLRRNIAKHGILFIPYRLGLLVGSLTRRLLPRPISLPPRPDGAPRFEVLETPDLHSAPVLDRIRQWRPDLGLSIGAPVLRPSLFQIPTRGTLNLHLGRVPDYRGAPPGFWELYTSAPRIGATVHWIDAGLDTGPVVASADAPIYEADTLGRVEARARELGQRVLAAGLGQVAAGTAAATPQPPGGRTFRFPTVKQRAILASRLTLARWRRRMSGGRGVAKGLAGLIWLALWRPVRDLVRTLRRRHPVRVFTFHRVTDLCRDGMTVAPDVFARQVAYVRRYHDVVGLPEALRALRAGARLRRPLAVLAFDDGYGSVWDVARPILARWGMPACCFVCTGLVGTAERLAHDEGNPVRELLDLMSWDQLEALRALGWTVGAHTVTHARLAACTGDALRRELGEPMTTIRGKLGADDVVLAYPFGGHTDISDEARALAQECGYAACLSNFGGENHPPVDLMRVRRIDVGGDHGTLAWKVWLQGGDLSRFRVWWDRVLGPRPQSRGAAAV